ncbi:MAG: carboxypeptidase regulatory-like domain-containing protein [Elusimicrobia bacterium]|nr:carboxypeptidase regulatory-like domain-containing protein [Elusimicrobiota bacterium]
MAGGLGQKNIEFAALTGQLQIQAQIPPGDDGSLVSYRLEKGNPNPNQWSGALAGTPTATATLSGLGTGLYTLLVENLNPGRGLRQESVLAIKNGAVASAAVDLTLPAFAVTGEIKVQGSIVLSSTWNVTVSSVPGLAAAGVTPQIDIFALPFPNHFEYSNTSLQTVAATVFESSATYQIPALAPGGYWLRVREDLNPPPQNCNGCWGEVGLPELANEGSVIFVGTAALTGVDLTLTNGVRIAGTITRPSGDSSTDVRRFVLRLRRSDNYTLWGSSVATDANGTADFSLSHIGPGTYTLEVTEEGSDARYGANPLSISVAAADVTVSVPLVTAGTIVGRLRDADSQTLLTADNVAQYLPENFNIAAQANPWVPGGYVQALRTTNSSMYAFDGEGKFRIPRLVPGTNYDLMIRGFEGLSGDALARGIRTYAPTVLAGILVEEGQTIDVGTIDLKQGGALSGKVTNNAGQPLANIRLLARPSIKTTADTWSLQVETFSDENGAFALQGIDRNQRYYDIIAAPRFRHGETFAKLSGPRYAEERRRMIDVNDAAKLTGHDFTLTLANGVLEGRVEALDGGILYPSFTDDEGQAGERGADIVLHREGAVFDENPLGEIEERTSPDGTFRLEGLKPGSYTFRALALGYVTALQTLVVPVGAKDVGLIQLGRGATVSGTIAKPDGSAPSSSEVRMVLGVDENFEDFLFGNMDVDNNTQQVNGYSISGFKTNTTYSLVIVTEKDDIMEVKTGVTFSQSDESLVIPLEYRPAGPRVFVNQTQRPVVESGVSYQNTSVRFFVTQPLRNLTSADSNLSSLVSVSSGAGTLSNLTLNSARDTITADYKVQTYVQEPSFALRLNFYTAEKNPETGANFNIDNTFSFYAGIAARRSATVPNVTGGDCLLEGEATGISFLSGAFDVAASSSVEVELRILDSLPVPEEAAGRSAPGRLSPRPSGVGVARVARSLGHGAYPSASLFAAANAAATVNPFSAFYDIFLPAGISHLLKKDALLTLTYDPHGRAGPRRPEHLFLRSRPEAFPFGKHRPRRRRSQPHHHRLCRSFVDLPRLEQPSGCHRNRRGPHRLRWAGNQRFQRAQPVSSRGQAGDIDPRRSRRCDTHRRGHPDLLQLARR